MKRLNSTFMKLFYLILLSVLLFDARAQVGQSEVPIGHKIPLEFWTKKHLFYINGDTVRRSIEHHKGKMVVLDFWFSGCSPCLLHQKDIASYVGEYPDDLVVIMVNSVRGGYSNEGYDKIDSLYRKKYFEKFGITHFETIIEDRYLGALFPATSFPHYVWINSLGYVQLRTYRNLLDRNYSAPFIDR